MERDEERLLNILHIRRLHFAGKGLSVSPSRLIDPDDDWTDTTIQLERKARKMGKHICIHTHFNHVTEISWVTRHGIRRLYEAGVIVRNPLFLFNGVNNTTSIGSICRLVHAPADNKACRLHFLVLRPMEFRSRRFWRHLPNG